MLREKKLGNSDAWFSKKMQKPPFLVILDQNGPFWKFLTKMAKTVKIIKKVLGTFFSHLQALTVKFQKKVMSGFREKALRTDARTHGQMRLLRPKIKIGRKNGQKRPFLAYPLTLTHVLAFFLHSNTRQNIYFLKAENISFHLLYI